MALAAQKHSENVKFAFVTIDNMLSMGIGAVTEVTSRNYRLQFTLISWISHTPNNFSLQFGYYKHPDSACTKFDVGTFHLHLGVSENVNRIKFEVLEADHHRQIRQCSSDQPLSPTSDWNFKRTVGTFVHDMQFMHPGTAEFPRGFIFTKHPFAPWQQ